MDFEVMHAGRGNDPTPTRAELLALQRLAAVVSKYADAPGYTLPREVLDALGALEAALADPLRAVASRLREMAEHHRTEWEKHERNECFEEAALARGACLAQSAAADMVDAALLGGRDE